jgi:hypothetical protein
MRLSHLLAKTRPALLSALEDHEVQQDDSGRAPCILFFSVCNGAERAHIEIARAATWEQAWAQGTHSLEQWQRSQKLPLRWLRVDAIDQVRALNWGTLEQDLKDTKRNYFEHGIAFDAYFTQAVLAIELGANALVYNNQETPCTPNAANLKNYGKRRFGAELAWPEPADQPIWTFSTRAVFTDGAEVHTIEHQGRHAGYRTVPDWGCERVKAIVHSASDYLARQVKSSGEYHYGWFPCFDRAIPHYNTLRHASSTYALLEGWELSQNPSDKAAIDRALAHLVREFIVDAVLPSGERAAFLVDTGDEIKLGGNAVCLLALVKYTELTGDRQHLPLMERLALGIQHMQDPATGRFVHVLNHPDLSLKAEHRIIYYDGEAAFGLMRLYGLTRDPRWLSMVEKAFDHFIEAKHWKAHDHWLSYCVNELTLYKPDERYYRFGLDNVSGHLDFVIERITTFPTLLELMMAAQKMVERLQADPERAHLLDGFDLAKFRHALEVRARYLLNGCFWPEVAMFFKHPNRIVGGFFIRHHSFRVRIDDVEHYLSGFVAYWKYLQTHTLVQAPVIKRAATLVAHTH